MVEPRTIRPDLRIAFLGGRRGRPQNLLIEILDRDVA